MFYGMEDIARDALNLKTTSNELRKDEFWAVDDVSFEVRRGECLGIIGRNGAGKSTLLKMLNGIFMPDKGKITVKGKVGALIEVGAGFHPMLTGRENIYVNGAILGMSKKEIDNKFNDIVEFAELEEFIDMPVKHYSSGMYVRLGFSIAVQVKPDVLILDEVLAVGDISFRAKCYNLLGKYFETTAVIVISHAMPDIHRLCSNALLLSHGRSEYLDSDVVKCINEYYKHLNKPEGFIRKSDDARFHNINILSSAGNTTPTIKFGEDLVVNIEAKVSEKIKKPIFHAAILDQSLQNIYHSSTNNYEYVLKDGMVYLQLTMDNLSLRPGVYFMDFAILNSAQIMARTHMMYSFHVIGDCFGYGLILEHGKWKIKQ